MTRYVVSCPGASIEQLQRASAAARAAATAAQVDPIAAVNAYGAHLYWDDAGFAEELAPTPEQNALMGAYFEIEAAAASSLSADGLPASAVERFTLALRSQPDELRQLLRSELGQWLSQDPEVGELLHVIQHGGLSARVRRIGAGDESYLDVEVGVGIGHCGALAHFGQVGPEDLALPRVIAYARKWNRALLEAPAPGEVQRTLFDVARAAWEFQRYQLDHEPEWLDAAASELDERLSGAPS